VVTIRLDASGGEREERGPNPGGIGLRIQAGTGASNGHEQSTFERVWGGGLCAGSGVLLETCLSRRMYR
jgi:hypothetical protein